MVEFLTPSFDEAEQLTALATLGVSAQSCHFLDFLIADPIQLPYLYRLGVLVQIPRPERFAVHKLVVADRRRDELDSLKACKDWAQASFLVEVLAEERPKDLADAYALAYASGPQWRKRIEASLVLLPETRRILESLVSQ